MAKYSIKSTQVPFKPGFKTDKIEIEAVTDPENKIISFAVTTRKGKKETLKNIPIKRGKISAAFKEAETYLKDFLKK
jgi:hypothetical protein